MRPFRPIGATQPIALTTGAISVFVPPTESLPWLREGPAAIRVCNLGTNVAFIGLGGMSDSAIVGGSAPAIMPGETAIFAVEIIGRDLLRAAGTTGDTLNVTFGVT